jgi:peptidoglycan/LPS O-acetylase OafA/YrhL
MIEAILAAVTATPTPTPTVDPNLVTPGPVGFVIVAVIVVFAALLIWVMQRRIRRVRFREVVRAVLDAEEAAQPGNTAGEEHEDGTSAPRS